MPGAPGKEPPGSSGRPSKAAPTHFHTMNMEERKRENSTTLDLYARLIREMIRKLIRKFNCQSNEKACFQRIIP